MTVHDKHTGIVRILFLFLLSLLSSSGLLHAQCSVLIGGTDFTDKANSDTLWVGDFNGIKQKGPSGNTFFTGVGIGHADSAQMFAMDTAVYAITSNPHLLDSSYINVDKHMYVVKSMITHSSIFSYNITGLQKGSTYTAKFRIYNVKTDTSPCAKANPWAEWKLSVGNSPDSYGAGLVSTTTALKPGTYEDVTVTGTLTGAATSVSIQVWTGYNTPKCGAYGISDLEVYGCYKPMVKSSQGIEICKGEQSIISLDKEYNASSYLWHKSLDGGKTWTDAGTTENIYEEVKADSILYYCEVAGVNSDTLKVRTIVCCVDANGNAMSRMTVFNEDFGHFTAKHTYVDADGNVSTTPSTWMPYRANTRFSMPSVLTYDASGQINDGSYGVVVPTDKGYTLDEGGNSSATWMNGVTSDHTSLVDGKANSAALFMNVTYNYADVIFSTQIDGVCPNKNLFFETYIANMSGGTNPEVTLNIKDATSGVVLATTKEVATKGAGWIRVHIDQLTTTSSSVVLEVVSTGGKGTSGDAFWRQGNDLVIDDIKFMVCSPPSVDIYSNMSSFVQDTTICANTDFSIGAKISDLLKNFFNNQQMFLYQQSADGKKWANISKVVADANFKFNTATYPADTNYFRVVVATSAALQSFLTDPNGADYNDKCRSYSISKSFKIIRAGSIDMGKDMTYSECGGAVLNLNGSNDGTLVKWGWSNNAGVLVPTSALAADKQYSLKVTKPDTLYFTGYNKDGCMGKRQFVIGEKPTVSFALDSVMTCGVTTITASGAAKGAVFKWAYGKDTLAKTGETITVDTSVVEKQKLAVTASATGYCPSDTIKLDSVFVNQFPSAPVPAKKELTAQVKVGSSLPLADMVTASTGIQWSVADASGAFTNVWQSAVPSQDLSKAGTYYYWIRQMSAAGCPSDTVRLEVVISEAPVPLVSTDTLCVGSDIDFSKYVTTTDKAYNLVWYDSKTATAGAAVSSNITSAKAGVYTTYVTQKSSAAESEKTPVSIVVIGVDKPTVSVDSFAYCLGSTANVLTAALNQTTSSHLLASGVEWFKGSVSPSNITTNLVPPTDVAGTTEYFTRQYFTNAHTVNGKAVCYGDSVRVVVVVSQTDSPTSNDNFTVNYLKSEGEATGSYKDVISESAGDVAIASADCELQWYDENKKALASAPSPAYDAAATADVTYTYYVSQKNKKTTCESELVKVTVNVSTSPIPSVTDLYYCEGSTGVAALTATINVKDATDSQSNYDLLWYTENPKVNTSATASASITPSTDATVGKAETVYSYYVTQKSKTAPFAESAPAVLSVHIYANPVVAGLSVDTCMTSVDLGKYYRLSNTVEQTVSPVFSDANGTVLTSPIIDKTGTYSVVGQFVITSTSQVCASTPASIKVQIDSLDGVSLISSSVCPGTEATVSVDKSAMKTNVSSLSYVWSGSNGDAMTEKSGTFTSSALGAAGEKYTFTVLASAGTCKDVKASTVVTVGNGEKVGTLTFTEAHNDSSGVQFNVATAKSINFYSCGNSVVVDSKLTCQDADGKPLSDYVWTELSSGNEMQATKGYASASIGQTAAVQTYRLSYTNKCATSIEFTIHSVPLKVAEVAPASMVICEGNPFEAKLNVTCAETPSISWLKDGNALSAYNNESAVSIKSAKPEDSGVYGYVVTNRGCKFIGNFDSGTALSVKPYIQLQPAQSAYVARVDSALTLSVTSVPSSVKSITWNGTESGNSYIYKVSADQRFEVVASDDNYCSDTAYISVRKDGRLKMSIQMKDSICQGNSDELTIDTTGTGTLVYADKAYIEVAETVNGNTTKSRYAGTAMKFTPASDASYSISFVYRDAEGVDEQRISMTKKVTVLENIKIEIPKALEVCSGSEIAVALTSVSPIGTVVNWTEDKSITSSTDNTTSIKAAPDFDEGAATGYFSVHNYHFTASYSICDVVSNFVPVKVDKPLKTTISDTAICEGQSVSIDASSYDAATYLWTSDSLSAPVSGAVLSLTPKSTASYQVNVSRGVCVDSSVVTVSVSSNPVITEVDTSNYRDANIVVNPATGTQPYYYMVDEGTYAANALIEKLTFGSHTAYVKDAVGCKASYPFALVAPAIKPNGILSPNGDGKNDVWTVPGLSDIYPDATVTIYDRWGKQLIKYKGADTGWDGTYKGNLMPSTDYWYEIEVKEISKTYTGHFTLLRQ